MNKLILGTVLLLSSFSLSAQLTTKLSVEAKGLDYNWIFKTANGQMYATYDRVGFNKNEYRLMAFDADLNVVKTISKEFTRNDKEAYDINYISFAGGLFLLKGFESKSGFRCEIQEVDQSTLEEKSESIVLFEVQEKRANVNANIRYRVSPNKKFLAIRQPGGIVRIFDETFSNVAVHEAEPLVDKLFAQAEFLSDGGVLYQFYRSLSVDFMPDEESDRRLIMLKRDLSGKVIKKVLEHEDFLVDTRMHISEQGNIVLAGALGALTKESFWESNYIGRRIIMRYGYFFIKMDEDLNELSNVEHSYENELILDGLKKAVVQRAERALKNGKKLGFHYLKLSEFIETSDGYYLIGEDYLNETKTDPLTNKSSEVFYHGPILALKLDKDGNLVSYQKVFKSQGFDRLGGFAAFYSQDKLYLLFNDYKVNEKVETLSDVMDATLVSQLKIYVVELTEDGMLKYALDDKIWKNKQLLEVKSFNLDGMFYIYAMNGAIGAIGALKGD